MILVMVILVVSQVIGDPKVMDGTFMTTND